MSYMYNCRLVDFMKHRSAVIRLVIDLQQQLCPNVQVAEYLTSRSYLKNWSETKKICLPIKSDLLPIENVANSMLFRRPFILASSDIISDFRTKDALKSEPYYQLSPSSVYELMDSSKADEPVSESLLDEVERICQIKQLDRPSHAHLRKIIDEMSIYAGKNPFEVGDVNIDSLLASSDEHYEPIADEPTMSDTAYASSAMSDLELHDGDNLKAEILKLKEQQRDHEEEIYSLQTKLKVAQQQIPLLEEELHTKQRVIEELQPKALSQCITKKHIDIQANYLDIAPELRGVEVCGEIEFEVVSDSLPQKLVWPGYGFFIEIPAGALPPKVTATISVKAISRGKFCLPENSKLISAIYWISCSEVFLKDVSLNIQHCAIDSGLRFITARSSQNPPYEVVEEDDVISRHTQYATILRKGFCCLIGVIAPTNTDKYYVALKFYKPIACSVNMSLRFVVLTQLLVKINEYKKQMINDQWTEDDDYQTIKFKEDYITLEIPRNPSLVVDNWKIVPRSSPLKIKKAGVDDYEDKLENTSRASFMKVIAPCCNIQLQWIGPPDSEPKSLFHDVAISGTDEPECSFSISYYPGQYSTATAKFSNAVQETSTTQSTSARRHELKMCDIVKLTNELENVNDWKTLGQQLGLKQTALEQVEINNRNVADRKSDMIDRWFKFKPDATWEDVVLALRNMDDNRSANAIEDKHCATSS